MNRPDRTARALDIGFIAMLALLIFWGVVERLGEPAPLPVAQQPATARIVEGGVYCGHCGTLILNVEKE